jgi:hypothetical protein
MSFVEIIPVPECKLRARISAMQTWFYKKKCDPMIETRSCSPGIMLLVVEFQRAHLAEAFRRTFDPPISPAANHRNP